MLTKNSLQNKYGAAYIAYQEQVHRCPATVHPEGALSAFVLNKLGYVWAGTASK